MEKLREVHLLASQDHGHPAHTHARNSRATSGTHSLSIHTPHFLSLSLKTTATPHTRTQLKSDIWNAFQKKPVKEPLPNKRDLLKYIHLFRDLLTYTHLFRLQGMSAVKPALWPSVRSRVKISMQNRVNGY